MFMKKIFLFLFVMMMFNQFSHAEVKTAQQPKCLVLYYSYSGVTKSLAEYIADDCGGTLLEVVDHGNYPRPESQTTYTYANNERSQIDNGIWPEINTTVDSFDEWDAVFICTPLWNGKMANPKTISFGGRNDVSQPTMFYYALIRTKNGNSGKELKNCSANEIKCAAFVRTHTNDLKDQAVTSREMMSISDLERITGVTYFPNVPNAPKGTFEASDWGL